MVKAEVTLIRNLLYGIVLSGMNNLVNVQYRDHNRGPFFVSLQGMKASVAEYWMLKELSNLDGYGTETFGARWTGADCTVAVSPHGVAVATQDGQRRLSIPFSSIEVVPAPSLFSL